MFNKAHETVSTCCSSCFASEENDLITLSTPEVASEGEVDSRSEKDVEEPRQPTVLEGGHQVPSMAYVTRHNHAWVEGCYAFTGSLIPWGVKWMYVHVGCLEPYNPHKCKVLRLCSPKWLLSLT